MQTGVSSANHTYGSRPLTYPARRRCRAGLLFALLCAVAATPLLATGGAGHARTPQRAPGYLGIGFHDLSDPQLAALHLKSPHGVEVILVDHDGPAGKAGLRVHDTILSLNGQPVANADALGRMIHDAGAGASITLTVIREGRTLQLNALLEDREAVERMAWAKVAGPGAPAEPQANSGGTVVGEFTESFTTGSSPAADPPSHPESFLSSMLHMTPFTGLAVEAMEPQLRAYFGAPRDSGLLVQMVAPGSPAAAAGLRAGDVVLRADGVALRSPADWSRRLHTLRGQSLTLVVLREHHELTLQLSPALHHRSALVWPQLFGMR